jgi:hypothetical protein
MIALPRRSTTGHARTSVTVAWLGSAALLWALLAFLTRSEFVQAVTTSRTLLGWWLVVSYLLFWGWRYHISSMRLHTLFRAIILTSLLLILVFMLELVAALGIVSWGALFRKALSPDRSYMTTFVTEPDGWFQRPPGAHWTSRPASDLESRWGLPPSLPEPLTFTFDDRGYRNPEHLDQADVALIGDSYIEGAYVSDDQTVARVLQSVLARPVANLGVAGFGPSYELRVLRRVAAELHPRVVVWFFFEGNDLYDPDLVPSDSGRSRPAPPRPTAWRRIVRYFGSPSDRRQRSFTYNLLWLLSTWAQPIFPNRIPDYGVLALRGRPSHKVYFGDYGGVPWRSYEEQRWGDMTKYFQTGMEFAREQGIHLMLVYIPTKFRVYRPFVHFPAGSPLRDWVLSPLPERFRDFCRETREPCLDLTEPFLRAVREGLDPYAVVDTHWGPDGHRMVAGILANELTRRGWLRPRAGRGPVGGRTTEPPARTNSGSGKRG